MQNKAKILIIAEVVFVGFLILLFTILSKLVFSKSEPTVRFDQYIWQNLAPNTIEPSLENGSIYEPLALKISNDLEEQTGISLETVVNQGGKIIFNFFYNDISPAVVGHNHLIEVIILSKDDKIIQDYFLEYTPGGLIINP